MIKAAVDHLLKLLDPDRVSTRQADLDVASRDQSSLPAQLPDVVVWPCSTEEIAAIVAYASEAAISVTARGAGSSLEGNPIPVQAGIVLDLTRMNRVLEVRAGDLQVDVEPGVVYADLNRALRVHGLFFPPSPGGSSDVATIGGMVANNASGIYSVKYGGTRTHLRAATVVTGTGEIVQLGNRCRKHSSGYDLLQLLIGSEGTLGVVTEVTLALAGLPQATQRTALSFPDDALAATTIADLLRYGVDLAAAEFLDRGTMAAINRFRGLSLAETPTLLLEYHGTPSTLDHSSATVESIAREQGGIELVLPEGVDPWTEIRHYATRAVEALDPNCSTVRADLAVPISKLPDLVRACAQVGRRNDCPAYLFGHAGIGILHVLIPARRESDAWHAALRAKEELIHEVIGWGGAVSGEHGMGLGNRDFAAAMFGGALELMKQVKAVFDPNGILNPGKIWD